MMLMDTIPLSACIFILAWVGGYLLMRKERSAAATVSAVGIVLQTSTYFSHGQNWLTIGISILGFCAIFAVAFVIFKADRG